MILWFVLTLELFARLQITRKCICTDWKTLEKNSRQIYKQILALKEFSQSIFFFVQSKKALNFELFFIVTVNETVNNKTKTKEIFISIFVKKWNLGLILLFLIHTLITEFKV